MGNILVEKLGSRHWIVRKAAIKILSITGDPDALHPLIEILKGENRSLCIRAIKTLGTLGDPD
ncbi:MAG: HEAT repeat domain-containing protein [Desulfobacterales bacterium]|nr:HEAT repeat domain-containing protein [Desulfobacterales bacterium]